MATNVENAQDVLFGKSGFGATNFKMFPGSSRDMSSEAISGEIHRVLESIAKGEVTAEDRDI